MFSRAGLSLMVSTKSRTWIMLERVDGLDMLKEVGGRKMGKGNRVKGP